MPGKNDQEESVLKHIAWGVGIVAAIAAIILPIYIYIAPYGVTINAPVTELHICVVNGKYTIETPVMSGSSKSKTVIGDFAYSENITTFQEPISITDKSWQILGIYIKPYGKRVTLFIENKLPGIDTTFAFSPFSADIQENANVGGNPPFDTMLLFKISSNATLHHGTYYITVKDIGQDEKEGTHFVLKVGENCSRPFITGLVPGDVVSDVSFYS